MDIVATSLEALIQRATSPSNPGTDTAAIDAFCGMVNKEPDSAQIAAKLITSKMQSPQEWEALQSLNVLEACMKRCGSVFHAEVGKFRFLNEMIKLVSPKYLGSQTPKQVRDRVLHLMYTWTIEHPRESKIKEAYQMLRKQGVIIEDPPFEGAAIALGSPLPDTGNRSGRSSVFEDDKKQRLLQKLLQSKNPEDLQAANRLIKTMVKEDERRSEMMSRRASELGAAHNNARLLSEMLDCYRPGSSSKEDLDLIVELHESCERYSFQINRDMKSDQTLIGDVMETVDELNRVFAKYQHVIVQGKPIQLTPSEVAASTRTSGLGNKSSDSLLDLSTPAEGILPSPVKAVSNQLADLAFDVKPPPNSKSDLDALGDIFGSESIVGASSSTAPVPSGSVLQPVSLSHSSLQGAGNGASSSVGLKSVDDKSGAVKALEDLDALGASLLQQSLPTAIRVGSQFNKSSTKVPMNQLGRSSSVTSDNSSNLSGAPTPETSNPMTGHASSLDLDFLVGDPPSSSLLHSPPSNQRTECAADAVVNGDDAMVDISEDGSFSASLQDMPKETASCGITDSSTAEINVSSNPAAEKSIPICNTPVLEDSKPDASPKVVEVKPLTDINVSLDNIKPGNIPPLSALDERNGISVILHLAKDSPRLDVSVFVVSTISKNSSPLSNYVFQAVVPKTCKLRLLPASSSQLPAHNPFLPPAAITQVMLVANPNKVPVNLKFMVSYTMDDETVTEMGEVTSLPMLN